MEIAQLCKSAYTTISFSNPYIFVIRKKMSQIWQVNTPLAQHEGQTMMHTYTP